MNKKFMLMSLLSLLLFTVACTNIKVNEEIIEVPEVEQVVVEEPKEVTVSDLVQAIEWEVETVDVAEVTIITGILENTTDEVINYVEIDCKFVKDGVTVNNIVISESNIVPGEKRQIQVSTYENFDSFTVYYIENN